MIKFFLMMGIVVTCVMIGTIVRNYLFVRCQIFKDFKGLCKSISNEISFLKTDKFTMLRNRVFLFKQSKAIIDNYLMENNVECVYLKSVENKTINDFLNSVGKMDIDGELNNLKYYGDLMEEYYRINEDIYNKYGTFSIKISIVIGVLIVIFLI